MRALIYRRVSTEDQVEHGHSLDSQEAMCRERADADNLVVAETYTDDGYSGAILERPALQRLLKEMRKGDVIYLFRLDRLSRDVEHTALLMRLFRTRGVTIRPLVGAADLENSLGRAFVGIQSIFAQLERETIAERVSVGMRRRVADGKPFSRPPYGYINGGDQWRIDTDRATGVRRMAELRLSGLGFHSIADRLGEEGIPPPPGARHWIGSTVQRILTNPVYGGEVRFGDLVLPLPVQPILGPAIWQDLQRLNRARASSRSRPGSPYLLSGLLWCDCGYRMAARRHICLDGKTGRRSSYAAYACNASGAPSPVYHSNLIAARKLDRLVLTRLDVMAADRSEIPAPLANAPGPNLGARLKALDEETETLELALLQGRITGDRYDKHRARIEEARRALEAGAAQRVDERERQRAVERQLQRWAGDLAARYDEIGVTADLKAGLRQLVERITVTRRIRSGWGLAARDVLIHLRVGSE